MNLTGMPTDKAKLFAYVDPSLKSKIERLADLRLRSVSNLVESVMAEEIARAEKTGELSISSQDNIKA
jgi:hypothetical protein